MRKLVLAASVALLAACSAPQQPQLNLMPESTLSTNPIVQGKTYSLTSKDVRAAQYVALVDNGRSNILPLHAKQNLRIALEEALEKQFSSQGFHADLNSNNAIELSVQEALVNVKHSVMENEMDAKVVLEITAETPEGKLVKTYTGTATRSGTLSASDADIEETLNDVVTLTLKEIANDPELRQYMQERF
ncbi:YajG family lipoprotein [Vibrio alginolyticus]|uniref:YajG family lipoprotein n=1 Tax=Vibrio alginolyticus TaxID=663 RepID=UPI00215D04EC|nr:YajG family lipoprotein [Vibrio alginolyticus]MCR9595503.1 YajG family lipoprotein [Vibrio alginolyticus]